MLKKTILFLAANFSALYIGSLFTKNGVASSWYQTLNKAPWTPPGWVFGSAWTFIMICFAIYMAYLLESRVNKQSVIFIFLIQLILNIAWNPIFFYFQSITFGMICIWLLTLLIAFLFFNYRAILKLKTLFLVPYLVWLVIASSLNLYILFYN
ncbi:TspO/MBR family protein [Algibacter sp. PT7-4]|uniref:TspO/MBR family protein n=1 Tax=Algibacter ulvanivorans TaxID=3400999 RepID=UPI003AACFC21